MTDIATEWWWPHPDAFHDLDVAETEDGWQLSAPDNTELAEWLSYWSQDEEHHELFQAVFTETLINHAKFVIDQLEQDGKAQDLTDGRLSDPEQAEDVGSGMLPEHESGSDS
jgi:hypothetical protein